MSSIKLDEYLETAKTLARAAGRLAERYREEGISVAKTKSTDLDIVTQADTAVEQMIKDGLKERFPKDGFFGEETGKVESESGIVWVVDPIDGTVNFLYGSPYYAVSIAAAELQSDGTLKPVVGAVYCPTLDVMYEASEASPALRNGKEICCNKDVQLHKALVTTGFSYSLESRGRQKELISKLATEIRDFRIEGTAALDICAVAEGRVDAYFQWNLGFWDYAAAILIAQQAGAEVFDSESSLHENQKILRVTVPSITAELGSYVY
ncbi:hypothetical protein BSR28_01325 [Boudabousia liubingyangii]|uniref:inositol monophosphatase family protein n=1 Tax=Boudabousia liubingyangii TaxID=1921764 RepID=UPI0009392DDE|nr:inositol monophosphatase family protein [Boudabousia liubingyangii]OKL48372.1 hypothetical protein BSR28_01325 [Boudabousia liubingyangii]